MKNTRSQVASSRRQRLVDNKKSSNIGGQKSSKKKKVTQKNPTKKDSRKDTSLPNTKTGIPRKKGNIGDSIIQASPVVEKDVQSDLQFQKLDKTLTPIKANPSKPSITKVDPLKPSQEKQDKPSQEKQDKPTASPT